MSVYSVKGKGWRYDFTMKGQRHTEAWFKIKREAVKGENKRKKVVERQPDPQTPIDVHVLRPEDRDLKHVCLLPIHRFPRTFKYDSTNERFSLGSYSLGTGL